MLIDFSFSNWMSYKDAARLSAMSSLERQHGETRAHLPGFRSKKVLPIVGIYGGNASGKTNVFKALSALKNAVVRDSGIDGLLPFKPFGLDDESLAAPCDFSITFLAKDTVYTYRLSATSTDVGYESLERVKQDRVDILFERDNARFFFAKNVYSDVRHAEFAAKSTRRNQLFLQSAVSQNIEELNDAYRWFSNTLELVGVQSQSLSFAKAVERHEGFLKFAGTALSRLDTGIVEMVGEPTAPELLPADASLHRSIADLEDGQVITIVAESLPGDYGFEMFTVRKQGAQPVVQRLNTVHIGPDGKPRMFRLSMESSGTQRLMGLLPMLYDLSKGSAKVYVVDELDRCLHTMLTKKLIEDFALTCGPDTRKQLLFTTHDLLLMDQELMRRDEMYIAERDGASCSHLVALSEYEGIRYDKDLIRSYLDGRFGGIPVLGTRD